MKARVLTVVAVIALLACASAATAGGWVQFYVDRNNNGSYDSGEQASGASCSYYCQKYVWWSYWPAPGGTWIGWFLTDITTDGKLYVERPTAGDVFTCWKLVYSQPAVHECRGSAGSMFDVFMDTNIIDTTGEVVTRKISDAEANTINGGGTIYIPLWHPIFDWNLVVVVDWNATQDYIDSLSRGFGQASKYFFDVADGQMKLGRVQIYNNVAKDTLLWEQADIQITANHNQWPMSHVNGVNMNFYAYPHVVGRVNLPQYFNGQNGWNGNPDQSAYYTTIIHELGHYLLDFWDEYLDGNGNYSPWLTYRTNHKNETPDNYGLMDNSSASSEMSSTNDYLAAYANNTPATNVTYEIWQYDLDHHEGVFEPCWGHVKTRFDNRDGTLGMWSGYNGLRLKLWLPAGVFQGRNAQGGELRSIADRDGPTYFPWPYEDVHIYVGPQGLAAAGDSRAVEVQVVAADGTPAANARVWIEKSTGCRIDLGLADKAGKISCSGAGAGDYICGSSGGRVARVEAGGASATISLQEEAGAARTAAGGPHILLDCGMTAAPENHLRIRVIGDQALTGPPTVTVRPSSGGAVPMPMTKFNDFIYEGSVDIGGSETGSVDVSATGAGGQSDITSLFRVRGLLAAQPAVIYGPEGGLEANLPTGALPGDIESVSVGSGTFPVPNADPNLISVIEPISFSLQDGAPLALQYSINWRINPSLLVGLDSTTLGLWQFNPATRLWGQVAASSVPGFPVISASGAASGIYGLFALVSGDVWPPGKIVHPTGFTGQCGKGVELHWTAPGDDDTSGQAVRYHVWFSDKGPISPSNLAQCSELPSYDRPLPAGSSEVRVFEMPDPDKVYFFAIQAQDEAGNVGELSDSRPAKSYVQDTDGDGLPDQWELAHGFDPLTPGEQLLDSDQDGLNNLQEYQLGTDPNNPDTDGDGISDELEAAFGTSPLDIYSPVSCTAATAKLCPDGTTVGFAWLISTAYHVGASYGEDPDRSAGIRFDNDGVLVDNLMEVMGIMVTTPDGERAVTGPIWRVKASVAGRPVGISNKALGGGDFYYDPGGGTGQRGIEGAVGLNNIGLLVKTSGKVTTTGAGYLYVDDGTSLWDGTYTGEEKNLGVRAICDPTGYVRDDYLLVTGMSTCFTSSTGLQREILTRGPADVVKVN